MSNHNFRCDSLTIHDGGTNQATELGKFCGNSIPSDKIASTSNEVFIEFKSDWGIGGKGFEMEYSKKST